MSVEDTKQQTQMSHCIPVPSAVSTGLFPRSPCLLPLCPLISQVIYHFQRTHHCCYLRPLLCPYRVDDHMHCPSLPTGRTPLPMAFLGQVAEWSCSEIQSVFNFHLYTELAHLEPNLVIFLLCHLIITDSPACGRRCELGQRFWCTRGDMVAWHACCCSTPVPTGPAHADPTYTTSP